LDWSFVPQTYLQRLTGIYLPLFGYAKEALNPKKSPSQAGKSFFHNKTTSNTQYKPALQDKNDNLQRPLSQQVELPARRNRSLPHLRLSKDAVARRVSNELPQVKSFCIWSCSGRQEEERRQPLVEAAGRAWAMLRWTAGDDPQPLGQAARQRAELPTFAALLNSPDNPRASRRCQSKPDEDTSQPDNAVESNDVAADD